MNTNNNNINNSGHDVRDNRQPSMQHAALSNSVPAQTNTTQSLALPTTTTATASPTSSTSTAAAHLRHSLPSAPSTSVLSQLILQSTVHKKVKSKLKYVKNEQDKKMFQKIDFLEFPFLTSLHQTSSNSSSNSSSAAVGATTSSSTTTPTITSISSRSFSNSQVSSPSSPTQSSVSQPMQQPINPTHSTFTTIDPQSQLYKMKLSYILNPPQQ